MPGKRTLRGNQPRNPTGKTRAKRLYGGNTSRVRRKLRPASKKI